MNKIINELEELHRHRKDIEKHIDSGLLNLISLLEEGEPSKEKLREAVLSIRKKVKHTGNK
ncbi:MAG: hypothetical protein HZA14_00625 [Nitrospirae bacterium]|nr:hypothetical protein [Nitrospirota bacterium]